MEELKRTSIQCEKYQSSGCFFMLQSKAKKIICSNKGNNKNTFISYQDYGVLKNFNISRKFFGRVGDPSAQHDALKSILGENK